jgi:trk system potassium uptake protein TrkA
MSNQEPHERRSTIERILGYANLRDRKFGSGLAKNPDGKVLVVGLGRFGAAVSATLVDLGIEVMAIDVDADLVDKWVDVLPHLRVADATDPATLHQLGVQDFDTTVVAIGTGIEASVLSVAALSDAGAPNIWAKATTSEHGRILVRVGADHVVYPEIQMGERVGHIVSGTVLDFFELDDEFVLAEIETPPSLADIPLGQSNLRKRFAVSAVCLKPYKGVYTYATAETVPTQDSLMVVAGRPEAVNKLTSAIRAEQQS